MPSLPVEAISIYSKKSSPPSASKHEYKEKILEVIQQYFDNKNLNFHPYVQSILNPKDCSISFEAFTEIPEIRKITQDFNILIDALNTSSYVTFNTKLRMIFPKYLSRSSLIIRDLPFKTTLEEIISQFYAVEPKPMFIEPTNSSWYIFFEDKMSAQKCLLNLQSLNTSFINNANIRPKFKDVPVPYKDYFGDKLFNGNSDIEITESYQTISQTPNSGPNSPLSLPLNISSNMINQKVKKYTTPTFSSADIKYNKFDTNVVNSENSTCHPYPATNIVSPLSFSSVGSLKQATTYIVSANAKPSSQYIPPSSYLSMTENSYLITDNAATTTTLSINMPTTLNYTLANSTSNQACNYTFPYPPTSSTTTYTMASAFTTSNSQNNHYGLANGIVLPPSFSPFYPVPFSGIINKNGVSNSQNNIPPPMLPPYGFLQMNPPLPPTSYSIPSSMTNSLQNNNQPPPFQQYPHQPSHQFTPSGIACTTLTGTTILGLTPPMNNNFRQLPSGLPPFTNAPQQPNYNIYAMPNLSIGANYLPANPFIYANVSSNNTLSQSGNVVVSSFSYLHLNSPLNNQHNVNNSQHNPPTQQLDSSINYSHYHPSYYPQQPNKFVMGGNVRNMTTNQTLNVNNTYSSIPSSVPFQQTALYPQQQHLLNLVTPHQHQNHPQQPLINNENIKHSPHQIKYQTMNNHQQQQQQQQTQTLILPPNGNISPANLQNNKKPYYNYPNHYKSNNTNYIYHHNTYPSYQLQRQSGLPNSTPLGVNNALFPNNYSAFGKGLVYSVLPLPGNGSSIFPQPSNLMGAATPAPLHTQFYFPGLPGSTYNVSSFNGNNNLIPFNYQYVIASNQSGSNGNYANNIVLPPYPNLSKSGKRQNNLNIHHHNNTEQHRINVQNFMLSAQTTVPSRNQDQLAQPITVPSFQLVSTNIKHANLKQDITISSLEYSTPLTTVTLTSVKSTKNVLNYNDILLESPSKSKTLSPTKLHPSQKESNKFQKLFISSATPSISFDSSANFLNVQTCYVNTTEISKLSDNNKAKSLATTKDIVSPFCKVKSQQAPTSSAHLTFDKTDNNRILLSSSNNEPPFKGEASGVDLTNAVVISSDDFEEEEEDDDFDNATTGEGGTGKKLSYAQALKRKNRQKLKLMAAAANQSVQGKKTFQPVPTINKISTSQSIQSGIVGNLSNANKSSTISTLTTRGTIITQLSIANKMNEVDKRDKYGKESPTKNKSNAKNYLHTQLNKKSSKENVSDMREYNMKAHAKISGSGIASFESIPSIVNSEKHSKNISSNSMNNETKPFRSTNFGKSDAVSLSYKQTSNTIQTGNSSNYKTSKLLNSNYGRKFNGSPGTSGLDHLPFHPKNKAATLARLEEEKKKQNLISQITSNTSHHLNTVTDIINTNNSTDFPPISSTKAIANNNNSKLSPLILKSFDNNINIESKSIKSSDSSQVDKIGDVEDTRIIDKKVFKKPSSPYSNLGLKSSNGHSNNKPHWSSEQSANIRNDDKKYSNSYKGSYYGGKNNTNRSFSKNISPQKQEYYNSSSSLHSQKSGKQFKSSASNLSTTPSKSQQLEHDSSPNTQDIENQQILP